MKPYFVVIASLLVMDRTNKSLYVRKGNLRAWCTYLNNAKRFKSVDSARRWMNNNDYGVKYYTIIWINKVIRAELVSDFKKIV